MKEKLNCKTQEDFCEEYPVVAVEKTDDTNKIEKDNNGDTLVYLEDRRKNEVDETIDTVDKHLSRYHYNSQNLNDCLELCPYCRKPNTYIYRKSVVDSALTYITQKEEQRGRHVNRNMLLRVATGLFVISAGVYYLFFFVLSGNLV